jgi:hypothetical protein
MFLLSPTVAVPLSSSGVEQSDTDSSRISFISSVLADADKSAEAKFQQVLAISLKLEG